ncbi:MAG: nitroreductase family protein [Treponema sp.]|nr:nitroreductase family protein [Treponema sp.]
MEFDDLIKTRHSVREYTSQKIESAVLEKILAQGNLAPTSRNKKPCAFFTVTDRDMLEKLSVAKAAGSQMLKDAAAAIVVAADSEKSDVWIEDASIAMTYLHLAATDAGLGSCWIQLRKRQSKDGKDSALYVKELLGLEKNLEVLAVLSLGVKVS